MLRVVRKYMPISRWLAIAPGGRKSGVADGKLCLRTGEYHIGVRPQCCRDAALTSRGNDQVEHIGCFVGQVLGRRRRRLHQREISQEVVYIRAVGKSGRNE